MKLVDPSVQKANLAMQCVFFGYLKFITFGKIEKLNNRLEKVQKSFNEVPGWDKL